ncbi:MATE family efflux transporter [Longirhabdus pacifica]|uniref:MATE family efflux transporter n=1 Tax=Longirhabdus pacifica TaxID=2305227 RepID=UPI001F0CDD28|nr:MATE family efflux transporter [Longirhabdus pacifica]
MNDMSKRLGEQNIAKLILNLSFPPVIGMLVMSLYNVVDTIFIARAVGTNAVAGVSIVFPIQLIMSSAVAALGIGGAAVISIKLGEKKRDEANHIYGNVIVLGFIVGILMIITGLLFTDFILSLLGATDTIMPYARDYFVYILFGMIFMAFGMPASNIARAEGNAKIQMITMITGASVNIVLDPIFIFGFDMGVAGAAIATVISQVAAAGFVFHYFFMSNKSTLKVRSQHLRLHLQMIKDILSVGSSAFARQVAGSFTFIAINYMLIQNGGELSVAVFGIVHKTMVLTLMPLVGIVQGVQPIVGYNYGARKFNRVHEAIKASLKITTIYCVGLFLFIILFSELMMSLFTDDAAVIAMGKDALRIIFLAIFTVGFQSIISGVFQALGKAMPALILSSARQILFLIPLILILPIYFGIYGVWLAFPVADILSFLLCFVFAWKGKLFHWEEKKLQSI